MTITLTREEAAKMLHYMDDGGTYTDDYGKLIETLRARLAQPELEPDKYLMEIECTKCGAKEDGILIVNAPPKREFIGLTDEEISELIRNTHNTGSFVRAIEVKLKQKNA